MCTLLDGKSLRLLELNIQLFEALRSEVHRLNLSIDTAEISRVIDEAQALIITPVRRQLTDNSSDEDLTEPSKKRFLSESYHRPRHE